MGSRNGKSKSNSSHAVVLVQATNLAALDFEILSKTEGKDIAIEILLITEALKKEDEMKMISH